MIMKLSTFGASASPSGVTATVTFAWPMRDLRSWGVQELSAGKWDAPPRITTGRLGDTQSLITGMTSMGKLRPTYRTREQMEHCEVRALKSQGRAPSPPCKIWILKTLLRITLYRHTSYLSFGLHYHILRPENFTLKSAKICDKNCLET